MKSNNFTIKDIQQSKVGAINTHLTEGLKVSSPKKSKYKNERVEVDGISFMSKREAGRYMALKMLVRCNLISDLNLQVPFDLNEDGKFKYRYVADFTYTDLRGKEPVFTVEDAKGAKTVAYKKKKKLMFEQFKIIIKET